MKIKHILLILSVLLHTSIMFAQQPIGKTKNARINNNGQWEIVSSNGFDGSTGGALYIDNNPYVQIDPNESYWAAGSVKMYKGAEYLEENIAVDFDVCGGFRDWVNPNDSSQSKIAAASMFFHIYHCDLAGFQRVGNTSQRRRIFFHTLGAGDIWHRNESEDLTGILNDDDEIRYIVGFVKKGDSIDDPSLDQDHRSGSFIYYQILDPQGNVKKNGFPVPPSLCYNSYDSTRSDAPYRVYLGSDSHGNILDQEASYSRWLEGLKEGDTNCEYKPSNMHPLLGQINRMMFVQGVLSMKDVNSFFENPFYYNPDSQVKLDFPKIIEDKGGYMVVIPNSHWNEVDELEGNGDIISTYFKNVPNTNGVRSGIRTWYSENESPLQYSIYYDIEKRHEEVDSKLGTVGFYLGNDKVLNSQTNFEFTASVSVVGPDFAPDTNNIFIVCSPSILKTSWNSPYLKIPLFPLPGDNAYFDRYIIDLKKIIEQNVQNTGYDQYIGIKRLNFSGVFDLAGLVLSNFKLISTVEDNTDFLNPNSFRLYNNYPNPFNPTTKIKYSIPTNNTPLLRGVGGVFVTLKVYDVLGKEVATLVNKEQSAGNYEVEFNASNLTSGVYFYRIIANDFVETKKMLLLR